MQVGVFHYVNRLYGNHPKLAAAAIAGLHRVLPDQHWAIRRMFRDLDLRIPVKATLGNGMTLEVFQTDCVGETIRRQGWYEPEVVRLLEKLLTSKTVFIDAGAHCGQFTLMASKIAREVHSFEPAPRTFELLRRNVLRNHLLNVKVNCLALAEFCGSAVIHEGFSDNVGQSSLKRADDQHVSSFPIACARLDSYVKQNLSPQSPIVVKMDVQGAELTALKGAEDVLLRHPKIIIEFSDTELVRFGTSTQELGSFLWARGYRLYVIGPDRVRPLESVPRDGDYYNVLALWKEESAH